MRKTICINKDKFKRLKQERETLKDALYNLVIPRRAFEVQQLADELEVERKNNKILQHQLDIETDLTTEAREAKKMFQGLYEKKVRELNKLDKAFNRYITLYKDLKNCVEDIGVVFKSTLEHHNEEIKKILDEYK